jgi:hypothetical protein
MAVQMTDHEADHRMLLLPLLLQEPMARAHCCALTQLLAELSPILQLLEAHHSCVGLHSFI